MDCLRGCVELLSSWPLGHVDISQGGGSWYRVICRRARSWRAGLGKTTELLGRCPTCPQLPPSNQEGHSSAQREPKGFQMAAQGCPNGSKKAHAVPTRGQWKFKCAPGVIKCPRNSQGGAVNIYIKHFPSTAPADVMLITLVLGGGGLLREGLMWVEGGGFELGGGCEGWIDVMGGGGWVGSPRAPTENQVHPNGITGNAQLAQR